jgi:hypothetical protein
MHKLWKQMQVVITSNTFCNGILSFFNKIFHCPFKILKAFSIAIQVLDCMKFQYAFFLGNPFFAPLDGE